MKPAETASGFVLAGGRSSRFGTDKALLPYRGMSLLEWVAEQVRTAAGTVTIVAPPRRYSQFGFNVVADARPDAGPLGGIETALTASDADLNLVVACDMPRLGHPVLGALLESARAHPQADCILGRSASGVEPLLAVYRRRSLRAISAALDAGSRKITDALTPLQVAHFAIDNQEVTANVNTPEDWTRHRG
ncbi:MAG: molybdenum cofactor guanylyltransferase [Bryobacteraceae bacterium]